MRDARIGEDEWWIEVTHAPTDDAGGHTSYVLLGVDGRQVAPFPVENYELTTPEHRAELARVLEARGLRL
jgi:hypothetical protein